MDYKLTDRELEVVWAVAEYGSNLAAGKALGISEQTVKNHMHAALQKVDAASAVQLYHRLYKGRRLRVTATVQYEEEP